MPCYRPLTAYQCGNGAVVFVDNLKRHDVRKQLLLPCGQCVGCRLERSRVWAARCMHEAQLHQENAFITLTYNDENNPETLRHDHWQKFVRKLRKKLSPGSNKKQSPGDLDRKVKISYYMAGEYGSHTRRPHYHACLFGYDFPDKLYWKRTATGARLYVSEQLTRLWGKGFTSIGEVTFESAAYIARYLMAKITGPNAGHYYEKINEETGEVLDLRPEYNKMSLKPAIGQGWLERYTDDVYPEGEILVRGIKTKTPKYYDKKYKEKEKDKYEEMKMKREMQAMEYRADNTPERLKAKETVKRAQVNALLRKL